MRFQVDFVHPTTSEQRQIVVALDERERLDAMRIFALRGARGPGGPNGPVAHGWAVAQASKQLPGFDFVAIRPAAPLHVVH